MVLCINLLGFSIERLFEIELRSISTFWKSSIWTSTFWDSILPPIPTHTLLVALVLTFHPAQALLIQMSFNLQLALRYDPVDPFKVAIQFWLTFSPHLSPNNLIALSHIRYFITSIFLLPFFVCLYVLDIRLDSFHIICLRFQFNSDWSLAVSIESYFVCEGGLHRNRSKLNRTTLQEETISILLYVRWPRRLYCWTEAIY